MSAVPKGTRLIPGQADLALAKDGTIWKLKDAGWKKLEHKVALNSVWYERTWSEVA
jgi:hypothetical protein